MEKTNTKTTKKTVTKEALQKAYITHLLTHGEQPKSIFDFALKQKTTEGEFYKYFNSFKSLERSIWADWFEQTVKALEKDEAYKTYSVREKILAFYFTWFQMLMENRSYVIYRFEKMSKKDLNPYFLFKLKEHLGDFLNNLIAEGKDSHEIAERPFSNQYEKAFWLHFIFLNKFWSDDESENFEKTDAAVEKSVNLALDLIGKGAIDSILDFGKFLFQNRKPF